MSALNIVVYWLLILNIWIVRLTPPITLEELEREIEERHRQEDHMESGPWLGRTTWEREDDQEPLGQTPQAPGEPTQMVPEAPQEPDHGVF